MMKKYWFVLLLLVVSLAIRLYRLDYPAKYYFDEVYHVVSAKAYAANNPAGYEWWHPAPEPGTAYEWLHPPIAKLFMAGGIVLFGPVAWAWRLPGVLFGVGVIWLTYWIGATITKKHRVGVLAAFFVASDGLLLAQSRIGMNDIYVTFFMLAAVGTYILAQEEFTSGKRQRNRWLWVSGLMTGLSIATKWSGVFLLFIFGVLEVVRWIQVGKRWWLRVPKLLIVYLFMPLIIYFLSYAQWWLQGHTLDQFVELHQQIWWYQTHLKATHPYQSRAWEWPLDLRPVWYFVDYLPNGTVANIYDLGNPALLWMGLAAIVGVVISLTEQRKKLLSRSEFYWLVAYVGSWLPWQLSPRIMFFYHYSPAIPLLSLELGLFCSYVWEDASWSKWIVRAIIGLIAVSFIWFLPIWIALPLSKVATEMRFWLPTWK